MRHLKYLSLLLALLFVACQPNNQKNEQSVQPKQNKIVVYQVMTRLFGNTNTTNKPWGTKEENGVGKFNDFNDKALTEIYNLGVTHIWFTGVPHHALIGDYTAYGISNDDPDVVKGRAGSPYAVKDYYNVDPDLAVEVNNRMAEYEALITRTHNHNMKVIMDIVPNHVARHYQSVNKPEGKNDFGANDDKTVEYHRNNNFYYVPGKAFKVPESPLNYKPLGGDQNPLSDGKFNENPAKWTGNGSRAAQPNFYDWYETVKINFGIKPDGSKDFDTLPATYADSSYEAHFRFWASRSVPDSWVKYRDICLFWIDKKVDGFRYDMAEMVPVEFWSFLNSSIKMKNPEAFLLAEIYNPSIYRDYITLGKMDYLYDKVDLYDTLRHIMQGKGSTNNIPAIQERLADIEHHMLRFLENHDEQRIPSKEFAGDAKKGKPAMVVSACLGTSPIMIYFGQEVGEPGAGNAGFGTESRTTIFDYWGVPNHQRWMNNGAFDGGQLTDDEKELRLFYSTLLNFVKSSDALMGEYTEIHSFNITNTNNYDNKLFSFTRWNENEKLIIVTNFNDTKLYDITLALPIDLIGQWDYKPGKYKLTDVLSGNTTLELEISDNEANIKLSLVPLQSVILKVN